MTASVAFTPAVAGPIGSSRTTKRYWRGTHRIVDPSETVARVSRFRRAMGITRLANVTGLDTIGIPVVQCVRPNSRSVSVSQGKGLDLAAAAASALMESVEVYHAERIQLPTYVGSLADLSPRHSVANVWQLNRPINSRFHPDARLLWVNARNLVDGRTYLVPLDCVHTDFTLPSLNASWSFTISSNGLASGNSFDEAVCHALCEVIERDAVTLWSGRPDELRRRVDLLTVDDADCIALLERFDAAGVDVSVWDATSDLGVPSYCVATSDRSQSEISPIFGASGYGCHPDRSVALARALTEAAQSRLTWIAGSRDDTLPHDHEAAVRSRARRTRADLVSSVDDRRNMVSVGDRASIVNDTVEMDVARIIETLVDHGMNQVLVVDLSQDAFGIAVARVIVPGLEASGVLTDTLTGTRGRLAAEQDALAQGPAQ